VAFRVGVLVSGEGTNLQALLDSVHGADDIEIVCVASSRAGARGLGRAEAAGVDTAVFAKGEYHDRDARDAALGTWLDDRSVDLIVLAGFMEILGGPFIRRFARRIINVHPSLLPAFAGVGAIRQALDYGVRVMGVTVHFVDEGVDSGPVMLQEAFELPYPRDIDAVEAEVHTVEHRLLPQAVRLIAAGAVTLDETNPRLVRIDEHRT
jgi:phosphoribosylglycinamide formyltransferase 1